MFKLGNKKIGRDTVVFNMTSATDCPSRRLGLCQLTNCSHCYALRDEKRFPAVLPSRRKQAALWADYEAFKAAFKSFLASKRTPIKYVRFSESGDFRSQQDVDQMIDLAKRYPHLVFYGYTARKDLSLKRLPKSLVISGSNWSRGNMNKFRAVTALSGKHPVCKGDCRSCNLCKSSKGITIEALMHGAGFNHLHKDK